MKKIFLIGIVVLCIIILITLYHDEQEYMTKWGMIPQAVASSIAGSIVGAGFLMIMFGDCNTV
jgi:hypothetical protein